MLKNKPGLGLESQCYRTFGALDRAFNRRSLFIDSGGSSVESCIFPFSLIHRRKLLSRIAELEEFVEQGRNRAAKLEKEKNKMQIEIRDVTIECDKVWFLNNPGCDNRMSQGKVFILSGM